MTLTKAQLTDSIHKRVVLPKTLSVEVVDSRLETIKKHWKMARKPSSAGLENLV